jgi:hypothetical protein
VVPTSKDVTIVMIDFKDKRSTDHLPIKIVMKAPSVSSYKKTITDNGGTISTASVGVLAGVVGLGISPVDRVLIEINA